MSTQLVVELLRLTGGWTAAYYGAVDPGAPGEPVGLFRARGRSSPFWQAIAREYVERWVHHCQTRRALALGSLATEPFLRVGVEVVAAAARLEPGPPAEPNGAWSLGPVVLGPPKQAADLLTRKYAADDVRSLVSGSSPAVEAFAALAGRP